MPAFMRESVGPEGKRTHILYGMMPFPFRSVAATNTAKSGD